MAPTITAAMRHSQEHLTLTHKLRKPLVEKLRRERINSSIQQLKSLLAPEFLKQQPDSKLEKADILEMTVCVLTHTLKQQQQHKQEEEEEEEEAVKWSAVSQGFSRCVQEAAHFLSMEQVKVTSQRRLINHFNKLQFSSEKKLREADFSPLSKEKSPGSSAPWRPW